MKNFSIYLPNGGYFLSWIRIPQLFPLNRKKRQIFPTELNLIPITYLDKSWFLA